MMHPLSYYTAIRSFFVAVPSCSADALAHPALESYFDGPVFADILLDHGEISHSGPSFPRNLRSFLPSLRRGPLTDFDDLKSSHSRLLRIQRCRNSLIPLQMSPTTRRLIRRCWRHFRRARRRLRSGSRCSAMFGSVHHRKRDGGNLPHGR